MDSASCAADMSARGMMYIALVAHMPRGFAPSRPSSLFLRGHNPYHTAPTHRSPPPLPAHLLMDRQPRPPFPSHPFQPQPTGATTLSICPPRPSACHCNGCVCSNRFQQRDTEKELPLLVDPIAPARRYLSEDGLHDVLAALSGKNQSTLTHPWWGRGQMGQGATWI